MPKFKWYYVFPAIPFYLIALLPRPLFYGFSDLLRFLMFYVFAYRKKVVFANLRNAFPEKDEAWIKSMAWKFYRNLLDTILETIQMPVLSGKFYAKHIKLENLDVVSNWYSKNQPFILICGHIANWEWAGQAFQQKHQQDVLFHPLSSKWFNWFLHFSRSRHGIYLIPMQQVLREMVNRKHLSTAITFIADQTPGPEGCHWMMFLNQETPVFLGPEKLAKKFNYPVVYGDMYRTNRGYYTVRFFPVTDTPNELPEFAITELHTKMLEKSILEAPENWLWSHKRWKHKRKMD